MATSEGHLAQAVDEALEPERRRALRRWACATAGRVAVGLSALWAMALGLQHAVGLTLPWTFFGFMGSMMAALAFSQSEGRDHLRKEASTPEPSWSGRRVAKPRRAPGPRPSP